MADQIVRCPYCVQGNEFRPIRLRDHWKKNGYRSIQKDLQEAFNAIEKDIHSKQWRPMARFSEVLGPYKLFRYRQRDSAAREGASGGCRIIALFDEKSWTLYPIIVFPKSSTRTPTTTRSLRLSKR